MYAGIFIALAAIVYVRCDNQIVGSLLFSVGLLACLSHGAALCTGRANQPWRALIRQDDKNALYPWWQMFAVWLGLAVINGISAAGLGFLASICIDTTRATAIVEAKLSHPWYWMLFMGFMCGLLIQLAVHSYNKCSCHWPIVVMCVMSFLLLGGEHCIADAAFIGMMQPTGDWHTCLGCLKLMTLAGLGNLLAGVLFYNEV